MDENITVCVRGRPLNANEREEGAGFIIWKVDAANNTISYEPPTGLATAYKFESVLNTLNADLAKKQKTTPETTPSSAKSPSKPSVPTVTVKSPQAVGGIQSISTNLGVQWNASTNTSPFARPIRPSKSPSATPTSFVQTPPKQPLLTIPGFRDTVKPTFAYGSNFSQHI